MGKRQRNRERAQNLRKKPNESKSDFETWLRVSKDRTK